MNQVRTTFNYPIHPPVVVLNSRDVNCLIQLNHGGSSPFLSLQYSLEACVHCGQNLNLVAELELKSEYAGLSGVVVMEWKIPNLDIVSQVSISDLLVVVRHLSMRHYPQMRKFITTSLRLITTLILFRCR